MFEWGEVNNVPTGISELLKCGRSKKIEENTNFRTLKVKK